MFVNGFLFPTIFSQHQQQSRKTISKQPCRVIVNALGYIRRESNMESTLGFKAVDI
jgi:hypothetical protein